MVMAYNHAQERGWNPVSLGRAPWLPKVYQDAVEFAGSVVASLNEEARDREAARARNGR